MLFGKRPLHFGRGDNMMWHKNNGQKIKHLLYKYDRGMENL